METHTNTFQDTNIKKRGRIKTKTTPYIYINASTYTIASNIRISLSLPCNVLRRCAKTFQATTDLILIALKWK